MKSIDSISPNHKEMLKSVGTKIKQMRKASGISYVQMAQNIGVNKNTYNRIENAKINFQFLTLIKILDYFNVPLSDFIKDLQ